MSSVRAKGFGSAPAFVREGILTRRHAWNDAGFRNAVKGGVDVSAALTALCAVPGRLTLPDAGVTISLQSRATAAATGLYLDGGFSLVQLDALNAGIDFTGSDSGIDYCKILGSQMVIPTAGAAVAFSGGQKSFAKNLRIEKVYNGISVTNGSEYIADNVHIRDIHGIYGIGTSGVAAATGTYGLRVLNPTMDAPYPGATDGTKYKGARVASAAYAANDIFESGGGVYQVTTGGTVGAGSGPNGSHGTTASRSIVDGTAIVQFIMSSSLAWISVDSFAYTTSIIGGALINGCYGLRMADTLITGSSYPFWLECVRLEIDHPLFAGASIEAGKDFAATAESWIGSCLGGNGVQILSAYQGGGKIADSVIRGNSQAGILLNQAKGFAIFNNDIGSNSMAANNTYNDVTVAAGVSGFQIFGNRFLPDPPGTTQQSARPVVIVAGASDGYFISGNLSHGHAGAGTVSDGGTGVNKIVTNNVAY